MPAGWAFEFPVPLIRLLEGLVDPIIGQGRIGQLQPFLDFGMGHPLHGHVHGLLRGFVQLVEDDEIDRDGLQAHPGAHSAKVEESVLDFFDAGVVSIPDHSPDRLGVVGNQGIDAALGKIGDVTLSGEEIEDAAIPLEFGPIKHREHGLGGQPHLRGLHLGDIRMILEIGLPKILMPLEGKGASVQNDLGPNDPITQGWRAEQVRYLPENRRPWIEGPRRCAVWSQGR